jgi:parvulin-like peptidyl-prolyl isomerase
MITLRTVVSGTQEAANTVLALAKTNADFGSIAQTQSTDLTSRQKDGVMDAEPARLLPENVRNAIQAKPAGDEIFGPIRRARSRRRRSRSSRTCWSRMR